MQANNPPSPAPIETAPIAEVVAIPAVFAQLGDYIQASRIQANACVGVAALPTKLAGYDTLLRFHYVKFDTDHTPKFKNLAVVLAKHVVRYAFSVRSRKEHERNIEDMSEGELFMLARDMFRKVDTSGEVGELLLFFLLEAVLGLPQVVAKMELKTNPNDEVKGCDGIHLGWDDKAKELIFYLGEAKLYGQFSAALDDALASITAMNDQGRRPEELTLMTSHFKHLDDTLKNEVFKVATDRSAVGARFVHTCLIGFDSSMYSKMTADPKACAAGFLAQYQARFKRMSDLLDKKLSGYKYKHLRFEFIFVPFVKVQEFRTAFYAALGGGS